MFRCPVVLVLGCFAAQAASAEHAALPDVPQQSLQTDERSRNCIAPAQSYDSENLSIPADLAAALICGAAKKVQIGRVERSPDTDNAPKDCLGDFKKGDQKRMTPVSQLREITLRHSKWAAANEPSYFKGGLWDPASDYPCTGLEPGRANLRLGKLGNTAFDDKDLRGVCFRKADLRGAHFNGADLRGANFYKADLTNADLDGANLDHAILDCANLKNANLENVSLRYANLYRTNVADAYFGGIDLDEARYEAINAPKVRGLHDVKNLTTAYYTRSGEGLATIRRIAEEAGMRKVEKEANFALRRTERMQAGPFEALFSYVVFQLPSGWGLYTWQPIALIFLQIPIFFTIFFFLSKFNSGNINIKYNSIQYEDVTYSTKYILIFSIVSNFNFSWKNFNVSGWLSPIFLGEAILEGTFWIGVVSRIQGFISLYLFATWVLMYFAEVWQ